MLVPETAIRLITEDLSLPRAKAIETLRESVEYGVAMFPADETEGDTRGAGVDGTDAPLGATEQLFMARAKARRKELEVEERLDAEAAQRAAATAAEAAGPPPKAKPRPRPRAKVPGAQTDAESATDRASSPPNSGKRKVRASASREARRNIGPGPGSVVIELSSDTGGSDVPSPPKRQKGANDGAKPGSRAGSTKPSISDATPKPKVVPRPRAKKPRSGSVTDSALSDAADAEIPPPSSSQHSPLTSTNSKADVSLPSNIELDAFGDATPRPKPKVTSNPSDTETGQPSTSNKAPLEVARERRRQGKGNGRYAPSAK